MLVEVFVVVAVKDGEVGFVDDDVGDTVVGPVSGLREEISLKDDCDGDDDDMLDGAAAPVPAPETRSLTFKICGPEPVELAGLAAVAGAAGFDENDDAGDEAEAVVETPIGEAPADVALAPIDCEPLCDSTFFNVSSTSAETHPALTSVFFIVSRVAPSFFCAFI